MTKNTVTQEEFKKDYKGNLETLKKAFSTSKHSQGRVRQEKRQIEGITGQETVSRYEYHLQIEVARYINTDYPDIVFESSPLNVALNESERKNYLTHIRRLQANCKTLKESLCNERIERINQRIRFQNKLNSRWWNFKHFLIRIIEYYK